MDREEGIKKMHPKKKSRGVVASQSSKKTAVR